MSLTPGTRLGPYEILAPLGAGGMGEVYRARDTKLNRDVAIKVLPELFVADPERVARFQREAKTLAALNHPHIGGIYGLEDADGVQALVLELVEGPTLAERIAQGPIPIDEALPIARQIAEALEAAHEAGIIHRDLKPANIKVRDDGTVKVLDFGLAKALEPMSAASPNVTASPTITTPAMMTGAGMILGTAAYMSPEQARGKRVDKRVDVWAFGVVLFEMLTGKLAFEGDDVSITLAAVLKSDPDWSSVPATVPPSLRRLLKRCLHKDPRERLRDIGEARIEIDCVQSGAPLEQLDESAPATAIRRAPRWRAVAVPTAIALAASLATAGIVRFTTRSQVVPPQVSRLHITLPSTASLSVDGISDDLALTPDGSRLIYVGANGTTLFVRPLDQLEPTPLVRGSALRDPFVSPDGQWVGFFDGPATLKKVPITGGPAQQVTHLASPEQGATWAADGIIVATVATTMGLQRISADGGAPVALTRPDSAHGEAAHVWPELLPGGQAVLCTVAATTGGVDAASIAVLDLRTGRLTTVLRGGSHAKYVASGHLVYAAAGSLRGVRFDLSRLAVDGTSSPVLTQVLTKPRGAVDAVVSRGGTLAYVASGTGTELARTLVWVDSHVQETPIPAPPRPYYLPRLSPNGTRVAVAVADQTVGIWLWDLARATLTRITSASTNESAPVWTPDGRRLLFNSDQGGSRTGALNVFSRTSDSTGAVERLTESPNAQAPSAVSPDGTRVIFEEYFPKTGWDVMALRFGDRQAIALVQTSFDERNGIVSPDGRWLAYEANDSGSFEIYVRPYPAISSGHWQVSTSGGTQPAWALGGKELFYIGGDGTLMRVDVSANPIWTADAPTKVLDARYVVSTGGNFLRNYDVAPDGQRFLMLKRPGDATAGPPQIVVVQHFDEELKRLVPTR
jgi:serine/threonine protein kinase